MTRDFSRGTHQRLVWKQRNLAGGGGGVGGQRRLSVERLEDRVLLSVSPWPTAPLSEPALADAVAAEPEVCIAPVPDMAVLAAEPLEQAAVAAAPYPHGETFLLHSNPTATKVIYLDFDGHVTSGKSWNSSYNGGDDITTPPYSFEGDETFSDGELERIQRIWERVAEDYLPFNVDVTTEDPGVDALRKSPGNDHEWGNRVVIGGNSDWYDSRVGVGGVAYPGSFNYRSDTPCYVFTDNLANGNEKNTAETASHEAGHTLNLRHDGTSSNDYYNGHGGSINDDPPAGWAPIMGTGRHREVVQWSKGEYPDANQTQDDLQIITTNNGFGYRTDDHGNTRPVATTLTVSGSGDLFGEGIIERNTDVDFFSFTIAAGTIQLDIEPFYLSPNLDILAKLYGASGDLIASYDPQGQLDVQIAVTAGTYYLSIDGVGDGDLVTGYSDYGSLGYYSISGTPAPDAEIAARLVFYNNSSYAGDDAIATDKEALLPGRVATFANYTSYMRGINGVMVDVTEVPDGFVPTASDFAFFVGNDRTPGNWDAAPMPLEVTLSEDAGVDGSDRVTIVWDDYAVTNKWLQVTVRAASFGLADDDVFYFGNAAGESGNSADDARVTVVDLLLARNNGRSSLSQVDVDFPYDYNRDAQVDATDVLVARNNWTSFLTELKLIDLSSTEEGEPAMLLGELAWLQEQEEKEDKSTSRPVLAGSVGEQVANGDTGPEG